MIRFTSCAVLFGLSALLLLGNAHAVETEDFELGSAADLIDVCTTPESDALYHAAIGFCHGYLVGAWEYYEAAGRDFVCFPEPPPSRVQVLDGFRSWMAKHAEHGKEGAVQALFKYLEVKWPCAKAK